MTDSEVPTEKILSKLEEVDYDSINKFEKLAKDIFSKYSPEEALSRALAIANENLKNSEEGNSSSWNNKKSNDWKSNSNDNNNGGGGSWKNNSDSYKNKNYKKNNYGGGGGNGGNRQKKSYDNGKPKDYMKLFVANLSYDVTEDDLKNLFDDKNLEPEDIYLVKDRETGKSRGFCLVRFYDEDAAKKAMEAITDESLMGRQIRVNFADKRERN